MSPSPRDDRVVPFHRPSVGEDEIESVTRVLRSGWLTSGPAVRKLEAGMAAYLGVEHAVAVSSGTAALALALRAYGVEPGDEVVTTPYTFVATAEVILAAGARPVFVDVDATTGNIDPAAVAAALTDRTRAIVPVHVGGHPAAIPELEALARPRGLAVIADAAHALETRVADGRSAGAAGQAAAFSFYATKNLTTGEGGLVTCDDAACAARIRRLALHGLTRDAWSREGDADPWRYDVVELGTKANLSDVAAALGVAQLPRIEERLARRRAIATRYREELSDVPDLVSPPDVLGHAWHLFALQICEGSPIERDVLLRELDRRGVKTSVHFRPLHLLSYFRDALALGEGAFPRAEARAARVFSLPLYPALTEDEVSHVVAAVRAAMAGGRGR